MYMVYISSPNNDYPMFQCSYLSDPVYLGLIKKIDKKVDFNVQNCGKYLTAFTKVFKIKKPKIFSLDTNDYTCCMS